MVEVNEPPTGITRTYEKSPSKVKVYGDVVSIGSDINDITFNIYPLAFGSPLSDSERIDGNVINFIKENALLTSNIFGYFEANVTSVYTLSNIGTFSNVEFEGRQDSYYLYTYAESVVRGEVVDQLETVAETLFTVNGPSIITTDKNSKIYSTHSFLQTIIKPFHNYDVEFDDFTIDFNLKGERESRDQGKLTEFYKFQTMNNVFF